MSNYVMFIVPECIQMITKDGAPPPTPETLGDAVKWLVHANASLARRLEDLEQKVSRLSLSQSLMKAR